MAQDKDDTTEVNTEDLSKYLDHENVTNKTAGYYVTATFKATRIINGHSIETLGKGELDFRIAHRFGQLNEGITNLFGLDEAATKFSFDYGLTDWLTIGIGRCSFEKEYDGFIKAKLLKQTIDDVRPYTLTLVSAMSVRTLDVVNIPGYTYYFSNRLYYVDQLLFARKFTQSLSLQVMPTYIHYNLVADGDQPNDVFAIGAGGRLKLNKRIALTGEYYYVIPGHKLSGFNNSVSAGIDIETGGHVFQLFVTNSLATTERTFIGETTGDITKGAIHLGFNISRIFTVIRPKQFKDMDTPKQW